MTDYRLDKTDYKILRILQENSKITNLDLSKTIGLSPAPTLERVKKLEQALNWKNQDTMDRFLEKIKKIDEVIEVYIITGEADALIKIICKDIPTYEHILFKKLSQIEEIERLKSMVTLSTAKESEVLPLQYD
jgi:DNA-binding Lrp family transcriptional regulator